MPERIFAYTPLPELKEFAKTLAYALVTGSTQALRNNHLGFLKQTNPVSQVELKRRFMEIRFEIYWRGSRTGDAVLDDTAACQELEPRNPYSEKEMTAETIERVPNFMLPPFNNYYP